MNNRHLRRIRDKDVQYIVELMGYVLHENYFDDFGNKIPPIRRMRNSILCRCIALDQDPEKGEYEKNVMAYAKYMNTTHPMFSVNPNLSVIIINSFYVDKLDFGNPGPSVDVMNQMFFMYMSNRYKKWNYKEEYEAFHKERYRVQMLRYKLEIEAYYNPKPPKKKLGRPRGVTIKDKDGNVILKGHFIRASKALHAPDYVPKKRKPKNENTDNNK